MYKTEREFRKHFPQNTMLQKVVKKQQTKNLLVANLYACANLVADACIYFLLANHIAPTDLFEQAQKIDEQAQLNSQYVKLHEKFDVTHEDIVGL